MRFNPEIHNRRSIRLPEFDYSSPGLYFVTICVQNGEFLFGEIVSENIILNKTGTIISNCWIGLPNHFRNIQLDHFSVMPNHIHGIIKITPVVIVGARSARPMAFSRPCRSTRPTISGRPGAIDNSDLMNDEKKYAGRVDLAPTPALGKIIAYFKYRTTKQIVSSQDLEINKIWQRNYYEHIIRNAAELKRIRQYIIDNPKQWPFDANNPNQINPDSDPFEKWE